MGSMGILKPGSTITVTSSSTYKIVLASLLFALTQSGAHSTYKQKNDSLHHDVVSSFDEAVFTLDSVDVLDRSIMYMHVAKDKWGEFNVREKCERLQTILPDMKAVDKIYEVPVQCHAGLLFTETGCDPNRISVCGADGIAQFLKSTAKQYGGIWQQSYISHGKKYYKTIDMRRNNEWAIDASARMLRDLYEEFGDWSLAVAAYHMGTGNMRTLRATYLTTMNKPLVSIDQLYLEVPSKEVIDFLASKDDDTFGYWIKVRNAWTLYQLYDCDRETFDRMEEKYKELPYDVRGIIAQDIVGFDHLAGDTAVMKGSFADDVCVVDDVHYSNATDSTEKTIHTDAYYILSQIESLFGKDIRVSCGTLDTGDVRVLGDTIFDKPNERRRYASHTTGRVFDIVSPQQSSDIKRLEYVLTILRYQGKLLWCRETDIAKKVHYHIVVLTGDPYETLTGMSYTGTTVSTK